MKTGRCRPMKSLRCVGLAGTTVEINEVDATAAGTVTIPGRGTTTAELAPAHGLYGNRTSSNFVIAEPQRRNCPFEIDRAVRFTQQKGAIELLGLRQLTSTGRKDHTDFWS